MSYRIRALAEDLDSMVSTHIMARNLLSFPFQGIWGHFLASAGTRCVHTHTQETHTNFFLSVVEASWPRSNRNGDGGGWRSLLSNPEIQGAPSKCDVCHLVSEKLTRIFPMLSLALKAFLGSSLGKVIVRAALEYSEEIPPLPSLIF